MVEIGIFRKHLHDMFLRVHHMEPSLVHWSTDADGHEVVFDNSNSPLGVLTMVNEFGKEVNLLVEREWCNDLRPLSDF